MKQILEKPNEQIRSSELNFLVTFLTKKAGSNPKAVRGNERKYSMESAVDFFFLFSFFFFD